MKMMMENIVEEGERKPDPNGKRKSVRSLVLARATPAFRASPDRITAEKACQLLAWWNDNRMFKIRDLDILYFNVTLAILLVVHENIVRFDIYHYEEYPDYGYPLDLANPFEGDPSFSEWTESFG
ncbi:uncharacterized protein BDV17DRAFT_252700 [Aspergillus undulatus]|uniref:uncharacterized protein n=1 Tax=Aspergillus undulatus TaxID=1810928 RepID=UPI003CCE1AE5